MPNYQNGKIYTIRSYETDEIYIGSTIQTLSRRISKHRCNMKYWKDGKYGYTSSYKILEYQSAYIELLEVCPCNSKMELEKKEGEYIRKMECVNKLVVGRTQQEYQKTYYQANKDEIKEQRKQYRLDNKDEIKEKQNIYYLDNKDKIAEQAKQYRLDNLDKIKEKQNIYYQDNKHKINEKHVCECGIEYTRHNKSRHLKSKKHQTFISSSSSSV